MGRAPARVRRSATLFIVLLGGVSLCADLTYEGARGILGPFFASLGASGTVVGAVAGTGELLGYALRFVSGRLADRTQRYWALTLTGYGINVFAVPLLAVAGHWFPAAALVIAERAGKAIRSPARDAMLSFATHATGRGWGFGLHEALDQVGATLGPLGVALLIGLGLSYAQAFAWLVLPASAAMLLLLIARGLFPQPRSLEPLSEELHAAQFPKRFYFYVSAAALVAFGFADYPMIAFHLSRSSHLAPAWIAATYALAMAVDGLAALLFGRWFDRFGMRALVLATLLSAAFPLLAFSPVPEAIVAGIVFWGVGMGAQESIVRAAVATMVPTSLRGTAFGVFHLVYGVAWFAGSTLMGVLYDSSLPALIVFASAAQLLAVPLFLLAARSGPTSHRGEPAFR